MLKLFHAGTPAHWAKEEAAAAHLASQAGVGAPRFDGIQQLEGRVGLIFERVEGPSMAHLITERPWSVLASARQLAARHAAIHRLPAPALRPQRARLERNIGAAPGLSAEVKARVLAALAGLPDGDRLCHGDLHPDNVLCTRRGPVVIDWQPACRGNPAADVARTLYLCAESAVPAGHFSPAARALIATFRRLFAAVYWRRYRALTGMPAEEVAAWRVPVLAARLAEHIPEEQARLVALVERSVPR